MLAEETQSPVCAEENQAKAKIRNARTICALTLFLFALLSSGTTGSGDAMVRYRVAQSIVSSGDISLNESNSVTVEGRGGKIYSTYGIGQSLLFLVPEVFVQITCRIVKGERKSALWEDMSVGIASLLVLPLVSAIGLSFLYLLLREIGFDNRVAVVTTLLASCGSLLLPYAKFHQEENQIAALTFMAVFFCVRFGSRGVPRYGILSAVVCWSPMWFRPTAIAESLPLAVLISYFAFRSRSARDKWIVLSAVIATGAITAGWIMFYNWYRFGSVTDTGYISVWKKQGHLEGGNIFEGLAGPFAHPSKSLFLYSPLIILALVGGVLAWKERLGRLMVITFLSILLLSVLIPSSTDVWGGDTAWGPRHQVASHALSLVFIGYVWKRLGEMSRALRVCSYATAAFAIFIQIISVPFNFNLEYNRDLPRTWDQHGFREWFTISRAQIPIRLDSLWRFRDAWTRSPDPPQDAIGEYSIPAFLPWKLGQRFGSRVWQITALAWVAGWVGWGFYCRRFLSKVLKKDSDETEESDAHE